MSLDEIIETQSTIIDLQNQLIRKFGAALNLELSYNDEVERIRRLKEKLRQGEGDHGL